LFQLYSERHAFTLPTADEGGPLLRAGVSDGGYTLKFNQSCTGIALWEHLFLTNHLQTLHCGNVYFFCLYYIENKKLSMQSQDCLLFTLI